MSPSNTSFYSIIPTPIPLADVKGSKQAGMFSIYVPCHYGDSCKDADLVCRNLEELPDIFNNLVLTRLTI